MEKQGIMGEKFREMLTEMVKASGKEIIDRAEELVGDGDLLTDFYITINFPIRGYNVDAIPTLTVQKEHVSKECIKVLTNTKGE